MGLPSRRQWSPLLRRDLAGLAYEPGVSGDGVELVRHPLDMMSVAVSSLGKPVALADHVLAISDALDELLTRNWGYWSLLF
jgi:hypothetical protein